MEIDSIFQQSWWLDIVAPGSWHEVAVEKNGQKVASWKLIKVKRYGMSWISMPPLTPHLGPTLNLTAEKRVSKIYQEMNYLEELIHQLPHFEYFSLRLAPSILNWLPFYWRGFHQTCLYTYTFDDLSDLNKIWKGMKDSTRNKIRKARKRIIIKKDNDFVALKIMVKSTFKRQNLSIPFDDKLLESIVQNCVNRNVGHILTALDDNQNVHASMFIVWDQYTMYNLVSGADDQFRSSGAMGLLIWESIKIAAEKGLRFDFEGSMVKGVECFFRDFGARQQPYFKIYKTNGFLANLAYWWIERKERAIKS